MATHPIPTFAKDTYSAGYRDGQASKLEEMGRLRERIAELETNYAKVNNQLARLLARTVVA